MAKLTTQTVKNLMSATLGQNEGNDVDTKLNQGDALASGVTHKLVAAIVATNVSQTIDFGVLAVGDMVAMIPATAGSADAIGPVAVAGTLGQAAVVGNLYLVTRSVVAPLAAAVTTEKF